jgi:hypothetical protein
MKYLLIALLFVGCGAKEPKPKTEANRMLDSVRAYNHRIDVISEFAKKQSPPLRHMIFLNLMPYADSAGVYLDSSIFVQQTALKP